jgi:hypothetical protein
VENTAGAGPAPAPGRRPATSTRSRPASQAAARRPGPGHPPPPAPRPSVPPAGSAARGEPDHHQPGDPADPAATEPARARHRRTASSPPAHTRRHRRLRRKPGHHAPCRNRNRRVNDLRVLRWIGHRRPTVTAGMYHRPDLLVRLAELAGSRVTARKARRDLPSGCQPHHSRLGAQPQLPCSIRTPARPMTSFISAAV